MNGISDYSAPATIASWLECLFFFVALLGAIKYLLPGKPKEKIVQPLVVTSQPTFADKLQTEQRFAHLEKKIEDARLENKNEMERLRADAVNGRRALHERIEEIPQKVINILRDTKDLLK